jgi:hypothetical protein
MKGGKGKNDGRKGCLSLHPPTFSCHRKGRFFFGHGQNIAILTHAAITEIEYELDDNKNNHTHMNEAQ